MSIEADPGVATRINPGLSGNYLERYASDESILARLRREDTSDDNQSQTESSADTLDTASRNNASESEVETRSEAAAVELTPLQRLAMLEKRLTKIDDDCRAKEKHADDMYDRDYRAARHAMTGAEGQAVAKEEQARIDGKAAVRAAETEALTKIREAEQNGEEIKSAKSLAASQYKAIIEGAAFGGEKVSEDIRRQLEGFDAEEIMSVGFVAAAELLSKAEESARTIIIAAQGRSRDLMADAKKVADEIRANAKTRFDGDIAKAQRAQRRAKMIARQDAENAKEPILTEIQSIENSLANGKKVESRKTADVETVVNLTGGRRKYKRGIQVAVGSTVAASVIVTALLAGGGGKSEKAPEDSVAEAAQIDSQLPKWEGMPVSLKAWREEVATSLQDERIAFNSKNYMVGEGTAENPGYANILYVMMMLSSRGNPESTTSLIRIDTADMNNRAIANGIVTELKLQPDTDPAQSSEDNLMVNARYANQVLDQFLTDPAKVQTYKDNPRQLYLDVIGAWNVPEYMADPKTAETFASLCVDWANHEAASTTFTEILKNPNWTAQFDAAAQAIAKYAILSPEEEK